MLDCRRRFDFRLTSSQFVIPPMPTSATWSVSARLLTVVFDKTLDSAPVSPSPFVVFHQTSPPSNPFTATDNNFGGSPLTTQVSQRTFVQLPNPLQVFGGPFLQHMVYNPPVGTGLKGTNGAFVGSFSIAVTFVP